MFSYINMQCYVRLLVLYRWASSSSSSWYYKGFSLRVVIDLSSFQSAILYYLPKSPHGVHQGGKNSKMVPFFFFFFLNYQIFPARYCSYCCTQSDNMLDFMPLEALQPNRQCCSCVIRWQRENGGGLHWDSTTHGGLGVILTTNSFNTPRVVISACIKPVLEVWKCKVVHVSPSHLSMVTLTI